MLVDLARLEREYYERRPDIGDPDQLFSFGTSGHRGSSLRGTFTILCMGGRTVGPSVAWDLVQTFLATEFSQAERHLRRLGKVASLEAAKSNEHLNFAR